MFPKENGVHALYCSVTESHKRLYCVTAIFFHNVKQFLKMKSIYIIEVRGKIFPIKKSVCMCSI